MAGSENVFPGDLNAPKKQEKTQKVEAKQDETKQMDKYLLKTFSSPEGKKVLEFLNEFYIQSVLKPVKDPAGTINSDMTTFGLYQQEGQKLLIKNIEMRVERAKSG